MDKNELLKALTPNLFDVVKILLTAAVILVVTKLQLVSDKLSALLICFDPSPELVTKDHPSFKKYPLITNLNVLVKNKIRSQINEEFPLDKKVRTVLHSSDNTMEAHHHLFYVLGREAYPTFCEDLLKRELPEETTS
ncbi:hypothetical protein OAF94_00800 [bacterium]|nr:hypothetical protein [bacterium]